MDAITYLPTTEFRYEIGENLKDKKRDLIITDKNYIRYENGRREKRYKYKCNKCGFDCSEHYKGGKFRENYWISEHKLKNGNGCLACNNQIAVLGINTIWDTDKWMCDLGVSEEDAKKYTKCSGGKIRVTCCDCGEEKQIMISNLYKRRSISCNFCKDSFSYPEKFMISLLNQLNIEFITQLNKTTFAWCGNYRYDFYISSMNMIIETHGEQHYEKSAFKKSLQEEQENDRIKKELALKNGIKKYIVIDFRNSELNWGTWNCYKLLNKYLDMSKVDFCSCDKFAVSNLTKEICEYWNNKEDWETTTTIARNNPWGIRVSSTISNHLKIGVKYGWCKYNVKEEIKKGQIKSGKLKGKKVEIFKDNISLGVFDSATELERQSKNEFGVNLNRNIVSKVCRGQESSYKGYIFKFV